MRLSSLSSYHVRPPKGLVAWHATRSPLLDTILDEGLKYGNIEIFFHSLPISRRPIEVFSGPARTKHLARDVWLELDLTGSELLVVGTSNFDFILEPIKAIDPRKIRIMKMDEVLQRATESEWIPCREGEVEFVFQEEFSVYLSLPILREIGWEKYAVSGRELVPDRLGELSIDEARNVKNSNLSFWLELSSMIQRERMIALENLYVPKQLPLAQIR
ncbi:MAG: hypothetical protein QQN63_03515 [Nitrosopumilus sp.]